MTKETIVYVLFLSILFFACNTKLQKRLSKNEDEIASDTLSSVADTTSTPEEMPAIPENKTPAKAVVELGNMQFNEYLPLLSGKRIAVVANQTSLVDTLALPDFLRSKNVCLVKIFALEHGYKGTVDRGEHFSADTDEKTHVPIVPMYGKNRKPKAEQLRDVDIVIFDVQDVGVRFYTYISSMHLLMEACAENGKKVIILDRPNPLGYYIDGPVLKPKFKSFVGMHPIPIVHGLTIGELALMINGEKWLNKGLQCDITVIKAKNYTHSDRFSLPVKPSPNLPNDCSIQLYPSLCFFEATPVSVGRGTNLPFQVVGYPDKSFGDFNFTPKDIPGMQMNPIQEGKKCYGLDLRNSCDRTFTLAYLIDFYNKFPNKEQFISRKRWFNLLAGNETLSGQIMSGMSEENIRKSWQKDLELYKKMRKKYLLYLDFEP